MEQHDMQQTDKLELKELFEQVLSNKKGMPTWMYIIVVIFSIGGSYAKNQNDIEYIQKELSAQCVRVEQIQSQMGDQRVLQTRLDERLASLAKELSEIKTLIQVAINRSELK